MATKTRQWSELLHNRDVAIIFIARLAMSTSRAIAGIAVPLYLVALGFSGLKLGVLYLAVALFAAILSQVIGLSTNRVGAKVWMIVVPAITVLAAVAYAESHTTWILFAFAAAGSFGRGAGAGAGMVGPYQPAESKLLIRAVTPTERNRAFSFVSIASTAGALVGTALAALLGHAHVVDSAATALFRPSMLVAAAFAAIAAIVALWIHEPATPVATDQPRPKLFTFPRRSAWLLWRLWATNTLNGLAVGMFGTFVTYWLHRRYGASQVTIGELYLVINIITLASGLVAPRIAARFGTVRATAILRVAQGLLLVPMALAPTLVIAGAIYLVRMFAQRIALPLRQSYALAMADPEEQSQVAALSNLPSQLAMAAAPTLTGYLFDEVSLSLPFVIGGLIQTLSALVFWAFFRNLHPPEERHAARTSSLPGMHDGPPMTSTAP
ncbi:major facilitator superfamily MFS_1 [Acidimicrobium ferrooxidans DSM 10331]|uniref:Major facilitator superfamily MFS_1 n=1 Tax=Acidimicrobium ferrooxidans (strain DSM 10331 / JCM 15462 / NBRC 103882 / ICP) TaxID=525909 RepID=C7LZZ7_ACIFD|nr:MFS transporter [Acidimicrobium ferrooxidans]ACU54305.1 major facilitator superfamily MFS_1 [Acidimicrobium ferrooxidans DSM 10331]